MIIFKEPADLSLLLLKKAKENVATGFVPTMGALHNGHIGLVQKAVDENDIVICSIFVNPSQFNDPKDFEKYPRTLDEDVYLLEQAGCDVLFMPATGAIYPNGIEPAQHYELGDLENVLEGKYRPGHFQGVCQVVHRLLDIVGPGKLYLGQKDFQQCLVIKKLIGFLGLATELVISPTLREPDGLAMSSRNLRLTSDERTIATAIYQALIQIKNNINHTKLATLKENAITDLTAKGFTVDYVEVADRKDLDLKNEYDGNDELVALAAAYLNNVRLIDNVIIN
ncbi:MAG: pantoate--beta-alanine ligase [Ferruginibacter sp.]